MRDLHDFRCPSCNSADVARVQTQAIYDELMECRSCMGIYLAEEVRGTAQTSAGFIEVPREAKRSPRGSV